MKFTSKCKISGGKSEVLEFPNMSKTLLIPSRVIIYDTTTGKELPCREVSCRISTSSGGVELTSLCEPYFVKSNAIPLGDYLNAIKRGCDLTIQLTNKTRDVKQYTVVVEYEKNTGSIIYQQKTDKFDRVLKDIQVLGSCTRLEVSFNRQIKELQLRTLTEFDGNDWISPLEVAVVEDANAVYTIEFVDDLAIFPANLNFMQFVVGDSSLDDGAEPLQMYITAYGYPVKK
jgi:hypothetical protein